MPELLEGATIEYETSNPVMSEFIGEVDEKNTIGYINSKLYYID